MKIKNIISIQDFEIQFNSPTMESGRPTREIIQPARPHASASASGNGQGSSSSAYHHRDCIVSRTVNLHSPYLPETPDPILGQVWIDHIVSTERTELVLWILLS